MERANAMAGAGARNLFYWVRGGVPVRGGKPYGKMASHQSPVGGHQAPTPNSDCAGASHTSSRDSRQGCTVPVGSLAYRAVLLAVGVHIGRLSSSGSSQDKERNEQALAKSHFVLFSRGEMICGVETDFDSEQEPVPALKSSPTLPGWSVRQPGPSLTLIHSSS